MTTPTSFSSDPSHLQRALDYLAVNRESVQETPIVQDSRSVPHLQLTSPLLALFEQHGLLRTPFHLTSDEETLILDIVVDTKLSPECTLYDALCFDLHLQLSTFSEMVDKADHEQMITTFKAEWLALRIDPNHNSSKFIQVIDGYIVSLLKMIHKKSASSTHSHPSDFARQQLLQEKKRGDGQHVIHVLRSRVDILKKFLLNPAAVPLLLNHPLKLLVGCQEIESATTYKTPKPFKKMLAFLDFLFASAKQIDPTLHDLPGKWPAIDRYFNSLLITANTDDEREAFLKEFQVWLGGRAPYLSTSMKATLIGWIEHKKNIKAVSGILYSENRVTRTLVGTVPRPHEVLSSDDADKGKLTYFKGSGLISASFRLDEASETLLDGLFVQYGLDSDITLLNLMGFALYERIGELGSKKSAQVQNNFKKVQGDMACLTIKLYLSLVRSSRSVIAKFGPLNPYADNYYLANDEFVRAVRRLVQDLPQLIPPSQQKKYAQQHAKERSSLSIDIENNLSPLINLFEKLLASPDCWTLLMHPIGMYQSGESANQTRRAGGGKLQSYWTFHLNGFDSALNCGVLEIDHPFARLNQFFTPGRQRKQKDLLKFREDIVGILSHLNACEAVASRDSLDALNGRLSYAKWVTLYDMPQDDPKSQPEFVEMLCHNLIAFMFYFHFTTDLLRLTEKHFFPPNSLTTQSCYYRLNQTLALHAESLTQVEKLRKPSRFLECAEILSPITDYFSSPPFVEFLLFCKKTPLQMGNFDYRLWLQKVNPLGKDAQRLLNDALQSLAKCPSQLQNRFKKEFSSLTLDELKQLDVEKIKEEIFDDCMLLLPSILILGDILGLLQKQYFQEKEAIIPRELAEVMDLDGLEKIVAEYITTKTVLPPAVPPLMAHERAPAERSSEMSMPLQKERRKEIPPPKKLKTRGVAKPPSTATTSSSSSSSTADLPPEIDTSEITGLYKSRKILAKLEKMGFFEKRQTGSHKVLEGPSGRIVVVPENNNLPLATTRSIAKQAQDALL